MAGLPSSNNVVDSWTPEPELRESPPRRFEPRSAEYPDLNQPNRLLYQGIGGGLMVCGLALLIAGLDSHKFGLSVFAILCALGGAMLFVMYPVKLRSHLARAEQLVSFGVPVIARILSADNLTGDSTFARSVKYQVVMPGGDMAHRSVNADERLLPSRVPGDTTALMDMASGDVELYCALPLRAAARTEPVSRIPGAATPSYAAPTAAAFQDLPISEPAPTGGPGAMPTLGGGPGQMSSLGSTAAAPPPVRPAPSRPAPEKSPEPTPAPPAAPGQKKEPTSLPWE